jgi:hypothetical protein
MILKEVSRFQIISAKGKFCAKSDDLPSLVYADSLPTLGKRCAEASSYYFNIDLKDLYFQITPGTVTISKKWLLHNLFTPFSN